MNWENVKIRDAWTGSTSNQAAKEEVGRQLAAKVQDGQVIGVGSGSTSYLAILAIAERVRKEKLHVTAVCTSHEVTLACAAVGMPVGTLQQLRPDWAFDGADEVDPERNLIKGRGGAMYIEKIMIDSAPKSYILVDQSKLVKRLGENFPIPVEVFPVALRLVEHELIAMGATEIVMRPATGKDGPIITQNGNLILDVHFKEIGKSFERDLKAITGVIETGLFMGRDVEILVA
jgi:ribose 5-phosphate isomerase A